MDKKKFMYTFMAHDTFTSVKMDVMKPFILCELVTCEKKYTATIFTPECYAFTAIREEMCGCRMYGFLCQFIIVFLREAFFAFFHLFFVLVFWIFRLPLISQLCALLTLSHMINICHIETFFL